MSRRESIVLLGSMTKMPVAGVVWQVLHYLVGFERLGYDAYYVEAHARTPSMLMSRPSDNSTELAASFIHRHLSRFGLGDRWGFHALHDDGSCHGMTWAQLERLYREAAAVINLHGGTAPREELTRTGRLIYLETDPVQLQVEIANNERGTLEFLDAHTAFFTFASNYGKDGCLLPVTDRYHFIPTRQPVVLDFWPQSPPGTRFTTIGNWKQLWRPVQFNGEVLTWSKHQEFQKVRTLPRAVEARFELALSSIDLADIEALEAEGWLVRDAMDISMNIDDYRAFIAGSIGEFTVAKEQNVRLQTGWFSDRSATYLASGRPVVTQDTGYRRSLPVGTGLLPFSTAAEAAEAVGAVLADVDRHVRAARDIAAEHFSFDVVLPPLLESIGLSRRSGRRAEAVPGPAALPADLDLVPVRKRPTLLPAPTLEYLSNRPVPVVGPECGSDDGGPAVSVIVVTHNNLPFLRLCVESVLVARGTERFEIVVVDNASTDGTDQYLRQLQAGNEVIRPVTAEQNLGFAGGVNLGAGHAVGHVLVFLNDDAIVGDRWLELLCQPLSDQSMGMVGPVTLHTSSRVPCRSSYRTLGEFLALAEAQSGVTGGHEVAFLAMYCVALRRQVYEIIGPLDEGFGLGLFEDDDYCHRLRLAGFRLWCEESVLLHHFGEATLGKLVQSGTYGDLYDRNRKRFEQKWHTNWNPPEPTQRPGYNAYVSELRELLGAALPAGARALVITRGDEAMLDVPDVVAEHFPHSADGSYAGAYPEDGVAAVEALKHALVEGAEYLVVPSFAMWWLEFYRDLTDYLATSGRLILDEQEVVKVYSLSKEP
jgi:GT2 family glycosyltransferase